MRRIVLVVMVVTLMGGGCSDSSGEAVSLGGARTYYEALDLSTPTGAAEAFLDAFARDDFMTVWLVFHPAAQNRIRAALDLLQYREVIDTSVIPDAEVVEAARSFPRETVSIWYLFDSLMLLADKHDAFIIDLSGPVQVTGETIIDDNAEVSLEAGGIEGVVTLSMAKTPSGKWRVLGVASGGPDEPSSAWPGP